MTKRWRYQIHKKDVGKGSFESEGSVDTVGEIVEIAKCNPNKEIAIYAPLDERPEETATLIGLGIERLTP